MLWDVEQKPAGEAPACPNDKVTNRRAEALPVGDFHKLWEWARVKVG